jgi:hypothetical protein
MKQITLSVEDNKYKAFLNLIQTLEYVSITDETSIPASQQQEVENRLKLLQTTEMTSRSWEEAKLDVFTR